MGGDGLIIDDWSLNIVWGLGFGSWNFPKGCWW